MKPLVRVPHSPARGRTGIAALWLAGIAASTCAASVAAAQDALPTTSVLRTSASTEVQSGLADAVDRLLRARLDALGVVRVTGSVSLDLRDVQLALGCVGETEDCLAAAAREIGVDALVMPSLVRTGDETVLAITFFRVGASPAIRRAVARTRGADVATATLEAVDSVLHDLFPQAVSAAPAATQHADAPGVDGVPARADLASPTRPTEAPPRRTSGLSLPPILLAAVAAATLGVGATFGVLSRGAANDWASAPTTTRAGVDHALDRYDTAKTDATAANVLFVAGSALAIAAIVWGAIDLVSGGWHDDSGAHFGVGVTPQAAIISIGGDL